MDYSTRFSRQEGMVTDPSGLSLLIVGAGGIGSNAAHLAVSTGFSRITIVDPDHTGGENLAPGWFGNLDIGVPKVDAIARQIYTKYGIEIVGLEDYLEDSRVVDDESFDLVLVCTDTLQSRREIWQYFSNHLCHGIYMDARMGGVLATVYAIEMGDEAAMADYTEELTSGREGVLPCGMKATAPLTKGWLPGMIGTVLFNAANSIKPPYMQRYDMGVGLFINQPDAPALEESTNE